jgi:hypothetical protein
MIRDLKGILCLSAALCTVVPLSRAQAANQNQSKDSTVAYVYVANTSANSSTSQITAYAASSTGRLTPVPGSPFREDVGPMVVNGLYLMALSRTQPYVNAYHIESNGAITYSAQTDYTKPNGGCGSANQPYFDHTGQTLYLAEFDADCSNSGTTAWSVVKSTGALQYLGLTGTGAFPGNVYAAYFIGNNVYAYSAVDSACMYYSVYGFKRSSNGTLTLFGDPQNNYSAITNSPTPPPSGFAGYIPNLAAADPTNHVAFIEQPASPPGCAPNPLQLAVYTAGSDGLLTTTSTYANMPTTDIVNFSDLKMSPSGKLLAVAGQEGLQIFHFNGANPITHYTGLITKDPINQMYWDNSNHLYAISQSAGKLYVFTITDAGYHQAPGSPYSIASPNNIIVQPWPLPWMTKQAKASTASEQ